MWCRPRDEEARVGGGKQREGMGEVCNNFNIKKFLRGETKMAA